MMKYIAFYGYLLAQGLCVWSLSFLLPRTSIIFERFFGMSVQSLWWGIGLCLPIILLLNFCFGSLYRVAPELGYGALFSFMVLSISNLLIFTIGELIIQQRMSLGDLIVFSLFLIGLILKYWVDR